MATIAIGDIHGNLAALLDLLEQLRHEVGGEDVVVFLGDYIDRGPDSKSCIDAILAFRRESPAEVTCLRGNHEDWLLVVYGHWNNAELDAHGWPRPKIVGNTIGIDTMAHGVLTATRMPDRQVFQSARHAPSKPAG